MTAEQIRQQGCNNPRGDPIATIPYLLADCFKMLREGVAQLAELNTHFKEVDDYVFKDRRQDGKLTTSANGSCAPGGRSNDVPQGVVSGSTL